MDQIVRVKQIYEDGTAQVICIRESACSGDCHKCSGCGAAKEAILLTAENPIGASVGDLVNIRFTGLLVKEFEVDTIEAVNVPEGLEVEIMEKKMTVALRGTAMDLSRILPEDIIVRADFTGAVAGTSTFKATVHFADELSSIGAIRSYSVTANLTEKE